MNTDNPVLKAALRTIENCDMLEKGDRVLAAVSGGADSVCMLHVLNTLKDKLGFSLYCAHLNHGIRGEAAENDEKFVVSMCKNLGIKVFVEHADVLKLAEDENLTVEEAGRQARYEFFNRICEENKINKTATAHNKNDNAETVLMRILRGTGIEGLKGISYVREDGVIRPILDISRTEIEEYCAENGLSFCTDETNSHNEYTRNKIRNKIIPYIEETLGENIMGSLIRLSQNATFDADFLDRYSRRLYERLGNPMKNRKPVVLHIDSLALLERSVATRVIRIAADEALSGIKLEKKHVEDVLRLLKRQTGAAVDLPCGLRAEVKYGWIAFENKNENTIDNTMDDSFLSEVFAGESYYIDALGKNVLFKVENPKEYKAKINETMINYDLLADEKLFLRSRREGDRMVCFADGRTKKIKSILIDKKIPRKERNKIPLLCTQNEIVAIVGDRVSEKFKISGETERALVIVYGTDEKA